MGSGDIKVGLIGVGAIAQVAHLPAYHKTKGISVAALCDSDEQKTEVVAGRYGIGKVYGDYRELLRDREIDVVDVCVPNHLHFEVVTQALKSGKDVICEKPLSMNAAEARNIIELVRGFDRKLLVAFNHRFRLDTSIIKARIERGEIGRLLYLKTGWIKKKYTQFRQSWAYTREMSGGGAFIDMGIHLIDIGLWLLGYPGVKKVSAFTYGERLAERIEDGGMAVITTDADVVITVEVSWGLPVSEGYNYLNVYGEEGSAHLNPLCVLRREDNQIVDRTPKISQSKENIFIESYRHEIEYFSEVLRGKTDPPPVDEQIILHDAIDAIYKSAETGSEIILR